MVDFAVPETRYALSGDVNIAYQTMGTGPVDIIVVPGIMSHVEFLHELPGYSAFMRRLSSFARVVMFDKRGQGVSRARFGAHLGCRKADRRRRLFLPANCLLLFSHANRRIRQDDS